ncbi:UNVERIFIED_CONTAM: putative disease resistance protein RGA3 [Sesamum latifolium]|uniref:Disease resistance protein RGA3 n=1 Tax=Sesamum latifolium TaxID=2727402 RepID=A0AAW2UGT3_9LAMI
MADGIVYLVLERLEEEVNLVVGLKIELCSLSSKLSTIKNVLDDAERRSYREKTVQNWLKKLEDVSYEIDDMLDELNFAALKLKIEGSDDVDLPRMKVCPSIPSSCLCFNNRLDIAQKIMGLNEMLYIIVEEKDRFNFIVNHPVVLVRQESVRVRSTSLVDVSEIHGREADKETLVRKLMHQVVGQKLQAGPQVISIVGVGGIGKTTLAQLVYNDDSMVTCFEVRIWVCVSDVSYEVRIAKDVIEAVTGRRTSHLNNLTVLQNHLKDSVSGKKILLVLDNVWMKDIRKWRPLKASFNSCSPGSKILVTTRSERVARRMGASEIQQLGRLSNKHCWLLMKRVAFFGRSKEECQRLQETSKRIANKCNGLPLAAKLLGSLLRFKNTEEEWDSILDSNIWQLEVAEAELFPHLLLSYNDMSPPIKRCFSYCAILPRGLEIDVEKLIRKWLALGYLNSSGSTSDMEFRGMEYFNYLRTHSFFQDFVEKGSKVYCKMHDVVHDFTQFLKNTKGQNAYGRVGARICSLPKSRLQFNERKLGILIHLRYLDMSFTELLAEVPQSVCKLYYLQTLYLSDCTLKEIPREIGKLVHLRHLDLSWNLSIKELPETIYNLRDLRTLNLAHCRSLSTLPEGIEQLINLRHLPNDWTDSLCKVPQGLKQLTGLQTLREFYAGRGWSKMGYMKKLDQLSGSLWLRISLHDREDVDEAWNAELRNKIQLQKLAISFIDAMGRTKEEELVRNEALEALQPPPNLRELTISGYKGTKIPVWISSCLNHLRVLQIQECKYTSTMPCLGKLPELEELSVEKMRGLKFVGSEFLGIARDTDGSMGSLGMMISFPKLKKLSFSSCLSWEEWEDITAEEEGSGTMLIMPCLKKLEISRCWLTKLPHRLLHKASLLEHLIVEDSFHLSKQYENGSPGWRSLSHIPHVSVS